MDVSGPRRVESSPVRRAARTHGADTRGFVAEEVQEARAAALTGAAPIGAVDTILALQGIEDSDGERKRGMQHGDDMLKLLDEVRDGLLLGGIPRATLQRLAATITKRRDGFSDPKLQSLLDEIELRARVELAKLERPAAPSF